MKQKEITLLKLFKYLERDPEQTQRKLAKELNVSLGLVNSYLKKLIQQDYFKIIDLPKSRIKYILTSKGMHEKKRLAYQYVSYSLAFYKETRKKIKEICGWLSEQGKKKVFIIGATELAEIFVITLQDTNLNIVGIYDNESAGKQLMGLRILNLSSIQDVTSDDIAVIAKTNSINKDLDLIQYNFPTDNIIDLRTYYP